MIVNCPLQTENMSNKLAEMGKHLLLEIETAVLSLIMGIIGIAPCRHFARSAFRHAPRSYHLHCLSSPVQHGPAAAAAHGIQHPAPGVGYA